MKYMFDIKDSHNISIGGIVSYENVPIASAESVTGLNIENIISCSEEAPYHINKCTDVKASGNIDLYQSGVSNLRRSALSIMIKGVLDEK